MNDDINETVYRWHQIMFRLDEMDEIVAAGLPEEEAATHDSERASLREEIASIESRLGVARVGRLRAQHERDRAYAQQMRDEGGS